MPLRPYHVDLGCARTLPSAASALEPTYIQLPPQGLNGLGRVSVMVADPDAAESRWIGAIRTALKPIGASETPVDPTAHVADALAPIGAEMADDSSALAVTLVQGTKDVYLFCLGSGEAHAVADGAGEGEVVYEQARHGLRVIRLSGGPDASVAVIGKPGAKDVTRTDVTQALEVGHSVTQTATWLSALGSARAGTACSCLVLKLRATHTGVAWRPSELTARPMAALLVTLVIVLAIGLLLRTVFAASPPPAPAGTHSLPAPRNLGLQITPNQSVLHWSAVPGASSYRVDVGSGIYHVSKTRMTVPPAVKAGVSVSWRVSALAAGRGPGTSSLASLVLPAVVPGVPSGDSVSCGTNAALPGARASAVNLAARATSRSGWKGSIGVTCAWVSSGNGPAASVLTHGSPVYALASWHLPAGLAFRSHQLGLRWLVYPGSPKNLAVLRPTSRSSLRIHTSVPGVPLAGTYRLSTGTSLGTLARGTYALVVRARLFGTGCPAAGCSGPVRQLAFRVR